MIRKQNKKGYLSFLFLIIFTIIFPIVVEAAGYPYTGYLEKYPYDKIGQSKDLFGDGAIYPWANEPLGYSNYKVADSGCGLTSITIQARRAGITHLKNGDELNPGNLAKQLHDNPGMRTAWVAMPDKIASLFKDGDFQYVVSPNKIFQGSQQGGYQNFPTASDKEKVQAIKEMIDKGYYPVGLINSEKFGGDIGHFIAINDADVDKVECKLNDSVRIGKTLGSNNNMLFNQVAASPNKAYSLKSLDAVAFLKFPTPITSANGSSSKENKEKETESKGIGNRTFKVLTDKFIVNGYGSKTKKDWDESDVSKNLPDGSDVANLTSNQRQLLTDWQNDYVTATSIKWITSIRVGIQILALAVIFISILLIFAYLIDRLGVLDFSVLYAVTGGKLYTVYEAKDDNFFSKKNEGSRGLSLKGISYLVLIMLIIAILTFTGQIYEFSYWIVIGIQKVYRFLSTF